MATNNSTSQPPFGVQPGVAVLFTCAVCGEEQTGVPIQINQMHDLVVDEECAKQLVVPRLEAALKSEHAYPPRYGHIAIDARLFLAHLPDGFIQAYIRKVKEYHTPLAKRVYCKRDRMKDGIVEQCGSFLGPKREMCSPLLAIICGLCRKSDRTKDDKFLVSCAHCGEVFSNHLLPGHGDGPIHVCKGPDAPLEPAPAGCLTCPGPNCGMRVELKEACNALRCPNVSCRTQFCAVCGEIAAYDSGHWKRGKPCPRFGTPGNPRALFDRAAQA